MAQPTKHFAVGSARESDCSLRYDAKCAGHASVGLARMSRSRLSKGQGGGGDALEPGFASAQRGPRRTLGRPTAVRNRRPKCRTVSTQQSPMIPGAKETAKLGTRSPPTRRTNRAAGPVQKRQVLSTHACQGCSCQKYCEFVTDVVSAVQHHGLSCSTGRRRVSRSGPQSRGLRSTRKVGVWFVGFCVRRGKWVSGSAVACDSVSPFQETVPPASTVDFGDFATGFAAGPRDLDVPRAGFPRIRPGPAVDRVLSLETPSARPLQVLEVHPDLPCLVWKVRASTLKPATSRLIPVTDPAG